MVLMPVQQDRLAGSQASLMLEKYFSSLNYIAGETVLYSGWTQETKHSLR